MLEASRRTGSLIEMVCKHDTLNCVGTTANVKRGEAGNRQTLVQNAWRGCTLAHAVGVCSLPPCAKAVVDEYLLVLASDEPGDVKKYVASWRTIICKELRNLARAHFGGDAFSPSRSADV